MVVIINGQPRTGKSTFVDLCDRLGWSHEVYEYSTVDFVKEIAKKCGWNGEKTPDSRKFLSDLKQLLTNWNNVPFQKTVQFIEEAYKEATEKYGVDRKKVVIFIHCREPHEIQKFVDYFGPDECKTLLMRRINVETCNQSNDSDSSVFNYDYNYQINNDGTIGELEQEAKRFLAIMRGERNG